MKYILLAIAIIVGGIYIKHSRPKNTHICPLNNTYILTLGDSLANGFGVNESDSFAIKIPQALHKIPIKRGIDGETTNDLLARINSELSQTNNLAGVIISIGGNDFLRKYDEHIIKQNLDNIIKQTKRYTTCIVILGVPSGVISGITGNISPIYKEIANKYDVIIDATSMPKILKDNDLKVDQIHPNQAGHTIIANNIVQLIQQHQ